MTIEQTLALIRPEVRSQKPYLVGGLAEPEVKLNQNESPFDLPENLKRELLEAFLAIPFNRYPHERPDRLRDALAERHGVTPDQILVGNGSNELTYTLGLCFISPGTPVVLPRPMFSLYEKVVALYGGRLVPVPPRADLSFDAEAILEAVERERPAYTVLTTPNNPTGLAMKFDEVRSIVGASEGIVVVDEAYAEFNDTPSATTLLGDHPNVLVMRTFSKAFGLAGLRIGYFVGHEALIAEIFKSRLPFVVDPLAETAALALLKRPDLLGGRVRELKAATASLYEALRARDGVEAVPTAANFVIFRTPLEPKDLLKKLAARGVAVRDVSSYPALSRYVRVNAGTEGENRQFLEALDETLETVSTPA